MAWTTYKENIRKLSIRLVEAQKPVRILDAIKWDSRVEDELKKSKFKSIPKLGPEYYNANELGYDPQKKLEEFRTLTQDIETTLGKDDPLARLLMTNTEQYYDVMKLVMSRGTPEFGVYSRKLYGSPKDTLNEDVNTISDMGKLLYSILGKINDPELGHFEENLDASAVVDTLNERLKIYFGDSAIRAKISDGIVADAAAGSDYIKVREKSMFSARDIDILEVHEGWVHLGSTQNGLLQPVAKWLSKGPPRCAATQEGLAVIMEIFSFRSYPKRARQINDRIVAIDKAEEGANILEIIEFFRTEGYNEADCISNAKRVFRGGVLEGGAPFTKDISYCRGFIENYNFMRAAIRAGKPQLLPFLFAGKMHVDDIPLIYQKCQEGIILAPKYVPEPFRDLNGLTVWMSFSSFLNLVDLRRIQEHYDKLFKSYL